MRIYSNNNRTSKSPVRMASLPLVFSCSANSARHSALGGTEDSVSRGSSKKGNTKSEASVILSRRHLYSGVCYLADLGLVRWWYHQHHCLT